MAGALKKTISDFRPSLIYPYFGQLFLAGIYFLTGFPGTTHLKATELSLLSLLYEIPRILMGVLAVIDTLLLHTFSRNVSTIKELP